MQQARKERRIGSGGRALIALACLFAFVSAACGREATAGTENAAPNAAPVAAPVADAAPASADAPVSGDSGHPVTAWAASVRAALARRSHRLALAGQSALAWSEKGVASWYGHLRQPHRTSSGRNFDPRALTAAHPTLPMGTRILVRSEDTGRSVVVTVNDRGPFVGRRVIDLSPAAAARIGMLHAGTAHVVIGPAPAVDMAQVEVAQADAADTSDDAIAAAAPGTPRRAGHRR